jgi:hypothetical protein
MRQLVLNGQSFTVQTNSLTTTCGIFSTDRSPQTNPGDFRSRVWSSVFEVSSRRQQVIAEHHIRGHR